MKTKVLVIAVIKKDDAVLMRKKPDGSPPYHQTWYLFGGELEPGATPEEVVKAVVHAQTGVKIRMVKQISWDTEIKTDLDGEMKQFVYLDALFDYVSGELKAGEGIEKLEWIPVKWLGEYPVVPPSVKLFRKLGYI